MQHGSPSFYVATCTTFTSNYGKRIKSHQGTWSPCAFTHHLTKSRPGGEQGECKRNTYSLGAKCLQDNLLRARPHPESAQTSD
eukprot:scaffold569_cov408-Prasinococcus_capsulatus_cf.AAC.24